MRCRCGKRLLDLNEALSGRCGSCSILESGLGGLLPPGPELEALRAHARRHGFADPGPGLDAETEEQWCEDLMKALESGDGPVIVDLSSKRFRKM